MKLRLITATFILLATSAVSQHAHQSNSVTETGQAQFAAIAEIVALLREDPETDWTQIDIDDLRNHLVDMDNLTTNAVVDKVVDETSVIFTITGDATVAKSIQRMVLAHSPMLQGASDWPVTAQERSDGATMRVEAKSKEELSQIVGLGFFGLMTIGAHHQQHHQMIALGHSPH